MKKRLVSSLCVLAIALIACLGGITTAYAGTFEEECDLVFREALEDFLPEQDVTAPVIEVIKEPLYDLSLDQLGFVYIMRYDLKEGFAIVINTTGIFDVSEFYMEAANPYEQYSGQNVYVSLLTYLVWQDDHFIETESGAALNEETIEQLSGKALYAGASVTLGSETIYFINRTANQFKLAQRHPSYLPASELTNSCTPTAGASVIGYWTRYYPELIPGFTPGSVQLGVYLYKEVTGEADDVVRALYYAMGTNGTGAGTTISEFRTGMTSYVNGKDRSISYSSTMSGGSFNYNLTKQKLEAGSPLVLFVDCFLVGTLITQSTHETISYATADACHAMAGFGYNEVTYTLTNGQIRTDTYIQVATGLINQTKGFYNINYNTLIDECYAITIS